MKKVFMPLLLAGILFACKDQKPAEDPLVKSAGSEPATATAKPMQSEFADPKYMDMGRNYLKLLQDGKIDEWSNLFADNAVYQWSSGDSLAGKKAIADYWKDRRTKVIQTISFANDIWLPIKVNQPQRGPDMPGIWLIGWNQVDVTYKNGKNLKFWVHQDFHYNSENKIDRLIQYLDRAPINAALGVK
jgi:hypothetical protein